MKDIIKDMLKSKLLDKKHYEEIKMFSLEYQLLYYACKVVLNGADNEILIGLLKIVQYKELTSYDNSGKDLIEKIIVEYLSHYYHYNPNNAKFVTIKNNLCKDCKEVLKSMSFN